MGAGREAGEARAAVRPVAVHAGGVHALVRPLRALVAV